jgi:hypothetical protein
MASFAPDVPVELPGRVRIHMSDGKESCRGSVELRLV